MRQIANWYESLIARVDENALLKQVVEEGVDHVASELFLCQVCEQYSLRGEVSMNIAAPIVPGESAAGIRVGSPIEEILKEPALELVQLFPRTGRV